ncbi:MAG: alpha/beta fold hydrolase [Actinomycetota bacterium]|nr:alpha/beta fold hydrolase [Actinomycetota bacterium]
MFHDLREAIDLLRGKDGAVAPRPDPTPSEGPDPYGNASPEWLRVDWSKHLRRCELGGARLNYVERGPSDGPAALLVHGLDGCWQNWLETIPHLARTHRVLALDLPGFGYSPMPDWSISVPRYAATVARFLDLHGVDRLDLVGNSLGGLIAIEAALAQPERVRRLVLVAPAGISSAGVRNEPAVLAARLLAGMVPLWVRFQAQAIQRPRLASSAFRTIFHRPGELRRELLYEHYRNGSGRPGFLAAVEAVAGYEPSAPLEALTMPAMIVWGRDDMILPVIDAAEYGGRLPSAQTVILDATGHLPQLERPVRFNRLLDAFLAPLGPG